MLVLTRKLMEKLYIGDQICVTVVRLEGGQVRLGIEAPRQIPVVRAELRPLPRAATPSPDTASATAAAAAPAPIRRPSPAPLGSGIRRRVPSR